MKKDAKNKPLKYHPIELYVGGNLGNNGIEKSKLHCGNNDGKITLFFESTKN